MKYFIIILLFLFTSCSPQKRLQRILKKHPELTTDTTIKDTFYIPGINIDTNFILQPIDTVLIQDDTTGTKILIIRENNNFQVSANEKPRIKIFSRDVPKIINEAGEGSERRRGWNWYSFLIGIISGFIIIFLIRFH